MEGEVQELLLEPWPMLSDALAFVARVGLGAFFAISGYYKLRLPSRRRVLKETLAYDGFPARAIPTLAGFLAAAELVAGTLVALGLGFRPACLVLAVVCWVACFVDGFKRLPDMQPISKADKLDDLLYLPETWLGLAALILVALGPDAWALDQALWGG